MATYEYIVFHTSGVNIPETPREGGSLSMIVENRNEAVEFDLNHHEQFKKFKISDEVLKSNFEINSKLAGLEKNQLVVRLDAKYKNTVDVEINGQILPIPDMSDASRIEIDKFYSSTLDKDVLKKVIDALMLQSIELNTTIKK